MIKLSHIGESLLSKMISKSPAVRACLNISSNLVAVPEVQLAGCGKHSFDGAHKVDVGLLDPSNGKCVAIEAKLGLDRLGHLSFTSRFLDGCGFSHNNSRIKGNMISILERLLPPSCKNEDIYLRHDEASYCLSKEWTLIVRQKVLDSWDRTGRPPLSEACSVLSFESLVSAYGSKSDFNHLVSSMVDIDYYNTWLS